MKQFFYKSFVVCVLGLFFCVGVVLADQPGQQTQEKLVCSPQEMVRLHAAYLEWSDVFSRAQEDRVRLARSRDYSDSDKAAIDSVLREKQEYALAQLGQLRVQGYVPEENGRFGWLATGLVGSGAVLCVATVFLLWRNSRAKT